MTDVSQGPYDEDGDARPVSLIGARIPASTPRPASTTRGTPPTEPIPTPRSATAAGAGAGADTANGRMAGRRRRRFRGGPTDDSPASVDDPRQAETFLLQDETAQTQKATEPTPAEVTDAPGGIGPAIPEQTADRERVAPQAEATAVPPVALPPPTTVTPTAPTVVARPSAEPNSSPPPADPDAAEGLPTAVRRGSQRRRDRDFSAAPEARIPGPLSGRRGRDKPRRPNGTTTDAQALAMDTAGSGAAESDEPIGPPGQHVDEAAGPLAALAGQKPSTGSTAEQTRLPAVPAPRASQDLWPWQEPWADVTALEPWEEIPVRESLADRAAAPLAGSWRVAIASLTGGSGRTTVTAMIGLTLAGIRGEPVLAVDLCDDLEHTATPMGLAPDSTSGMSLADRVGAYPSATVSDLVADAISYRARRGGATRPVSELRWLINGGADGTYLSGDAAGLDVLPACRPSEPAAPAAPRSGKARVTTSAPTDQVAAPPPALVPAGMPGPLTPQVLASAFATLGVAYPLVLVDTPLDWNSPLASITLGDARVIVLVVPALPGDLTEAAASLRASGGLRADHGGPPPAVIVAAVSVRRGRWSPQTRSAAAKLARRVDAIVRIPYDARLDDTVTDVAPARPGNSPSRRDNAGRGQRNSVPIPFFRLRWRSRRAFLRLAATVVDACRDQDDIGVNNDEIGDTATAATSVTHDRIAAPGVSSDDLRADLAPGREQQ
ncbi:hypothetical protein [Frankia sp. CiP3]|uniref:hypothetical protein n=1 Tax=Frankia sp. CiP3 TaxID=2880971 RepID=UPI001EF44057|nr:hypothetical protein [Frankia sp. CiP3]